VITTSKSFSPLVTSMCISFVVGLYLPDYLQACSIAARQVSVQKAGADSNAKAHTPPAGSPERKDVMDGLRGDQKVVFKVHYLKVHGDWAFVDVTPLNDKGKPEAEGGASLMHKENGSWKVMDLSVLPEDPEQSDGTRRPDAEVREGGSEEVSRSARRHFSTASPPKMSNRWATLHAIVLSA
jgi:hypothetical protein